MDAPRTPAAEFRHEIDPIKGSRFLATLAPVADEAEGEALVERLRAEFPGATHHCWAWRLPQDGTRFRSSDDGEPAGSAGRPILAQIEGHGVVGAALVVTRWFGGTKLGVGGLVRAYGAAAGKTLDRAPLVPWIVMRRIVVEHPYACAGAVEGVLAAHGLAPLSGDWGEAVRLVLEVPEAKLEAVRTELRDRTAGRAVCRTEA